MTAITLLMYTFFVINYAITGSIKGSKQIGKYIRVFSVIGIFVAYLFSTNSYIKESEIANANIIEINDDTFTYGFNAEDNTYITNTVNIEEINFTGDIGDSVLVRYLNAQPQKNKINTYDTIFNTEFAFISLSVFIIFLLWGVLSVNNAFNKKNHNKKKVLLCCIGYIVSISLFICFVLNIIKITENAYFTGDANTATATVVKTDIIGTEYEFTAKNNSKVTGKAIGVYGYEMPVGTSVLVEYDTNGKSRIKNHILASRPYTVIAWCFVPFIAFGFGTILSYIINAKKLNCKIFASNIFKEKSEQKNIPKRNIFAIACKILAVALFAEAIMQMRYNFSTGILMLFMSAFWILFTIAFDKFSKK